MSDAIQKSDIQKPKTSTDRAVEELRQMIFSGDLAAGTDHLEAELAERLGMSRTPVREATLTLRNQGLLELRPRKGVRIRSISPDDMREVYDVLTELESLAAERAAEANYGPEELSELVSAIEEMEAALENTDLEKWADADQRFHTELVRLGGNKRLASIVGMMSDQVRRARLATLFMRELPTTSNEDHRAVYDAIRTGNASEARTRHRDHRRQAMQMLVGLLEKHRLKFL